MFVCVCGGGGGGSTTGEATRNESESDYIILLFTGQIKETETQWQSAC